MGENKTTEQKKEKCSWPGCQEKSFMHMSLQLMEPNGNGGVQPVKSPGNDPENEMLGVPVPLCEYHWMFGEFCFAVQDPKDKNHIMLKTPNDILRLVERAIQASVISGQFEQAQAERVKIEAHRKQFEEKLNEHNKTKAKDTTNQKDKKD